MGPLGSVVDVRHDGECHYLWTCLHVVAIEHDAVALLVVVVVEHGIDGAVVFLAFHHLLLAVGEHIATLVFVVSAESGRLETYRHAKLGCLHGILQCLGGIELTYKEVAGSDRHLGHRTEASGVAGGEFHAGAVVAFFHGHGRVFIRFCRTLAHVEARVSGSPVVGQRAIIVLVAPYIISVYRLVFVEEEVFKVVLHLFVDNGREGEAHLILAFPFAIFRCNGVDDRTVGEILFRTVGRR